ncbi:hypothetical protein [Paraburkholderia fynbosensis]|nr:hypothetical protein [Paraburkholderia fynbosensis]
MSLSVERRGAIGARLPREESARKDAADQQSSGRDDVLDGAD